MPKSGFVYIIQSASGHYKIGRTTGSVEGRLNTLKTGCPFPVILFHKISCEDCAQVEAIFHKHFSRKRVHGEWFLLDSYDLTWLESFEDIYIDSEIKLIDPWEDYCDAAAAEAETFLYWHEENTPLWGPL